MFDSGLAVDERPKRPRDRDDLPFGEPDRERIPDNVLDRDPKIEGLAGRNGRLEVDVSGDSSVVIDRLFRTSSVGKEELVGGWPALPSPCEVMDCRNGVSWRCGKVMTRALST